MVSGRWAIVKRGGGVQPVGPGCPHGPSRCPLQAPRVPEGPDPHEPSPHAWHLLRLTVSRAREDRGSRHRPSPLQWWWPRPVVTRGRDRGTVCPSFQMLACSAPSVGSLGGRGSPALPRESRLQTRGRFLLGRPRCFVPGVQVGGVPGPGPGTSGPQRATQQAPSPSGPRPEGLRPSWESRS